MQVSLLGTLRVRRFGQEISIPAAKQRVVLATLAVNASSYVPLELLVDELWEHRPPATAVRTVQTYVYQLRRSLQLAGARKAPDDQRAALLTSSSHGYLLRLGERSEVDTVRFRALIGSARACIALGDGDQAVREFRAALALWSGPAFGDVPLGTHLTAHLLSLQQVRTSAQEMLFETQLRRGRHEEVVDDLVELTHRDPTQERFSALLMIALHRVGHRAEALRVFHRLRVELRDQLGVPPSPEVQRVLNEILSDRITGVTIHAGASASLSRS